jgi:hypothetical protein
MQFKYLILPGFYQALYYHHTPLAKFLHSSKYHGRRHGFLIRSLEGCLQWDVGVPI